MQSSRSGNKYPTGKFASTSASFQDVSANKARRAIGPVSAYDPGYEEWNAEIRPDSVSNDRNDPVALYDLRR